jgi:hypothetical protein
MLGHTFTIKSVDNMKMLDIKSFVFKNSLLRSTAGTKVSDFYF